MHKHRYETEKELALSFLALVDLAFLNDPLGVHDDIYEYDLSLIHISPIGWYRVQAGSLFHNSLINGNQYGTGTFGIVIRNRKQCTAFGFCFLLHHGTISGWRGR